MWKGDEGGKDLRMEEEEVFVKVGEWFLWEGEEGEWKEWEEGKEMNVD